jgi:hypothetical protein
MKFLENLIKKPIVFQRVIGLKLEQLVLLSKRIEPLWQAEELKRLNRSGRKRAIGAGHPYAFITMQEKITAVLIYYKSYLTQEFLGIILGVNQSAISRLVNKMMPLIEEAADPNLKLFLNEVKEVVEKEKINTLEKLIEKYPDLKDISTDATEQECFRSSDNETQKEFYSGKSHQHAVKAQLTVSNITGRILDISDTYSGKTHDKAIIDNEKTVEKFPKFVSHRFDLGYQGLVKEYPDTYVILPQKKPIKKELSSFAKELNKINSRYRVKVEHALSRLKKFRILGQLFRNPIKSHNVVFRGVAALLNFKLDCAMNIM